MKHLSEFTDLTRAQVEALLECFDLLRNGYIQVIDFCVDDTWIIKMRHSKNHRWIVVTIKPDRYKIVRDGKVQKSVEVRANSNRYKLFVNSDMTVGVVKLSRGADVNSVSG